MRNVLIIAYYWPPAGGGGVQRWLKFTRYLPEYGWHPVVYVPYNPQYPLEDRSLLKSVPDNVEVIKGYIWEARRFYRRLKKIRHGSKWSAAPEMDTLFFRDPSQMSWFGRFALFLRSNLFVPDSRCLWIKPSAKRLRKWLSQHHVDAIISTGPPHSCHLIALKLKKATGLPWIADFRDPWLEIDYFPQLMLTRGTRRMHERMQHEVLSSADRVITVSWSWAELFKKYGARNVDVITNGFDLSDFTSVVETPIDRSIFVIANIGTLELDRNPQGLWKAVEQLLEADPRLKDRLEIHFAGKIDRATLPEHGAIAERIINHGYLSHQQALSLMKRADLLLLPLNQIDTVNTKGRIPGKLFEYIATGNPILMLGSTESDSAKIVAQLGNSWCCSNDDTGAIQKVLHDCMAKQSAGKPTPDLDHSHFERRMLTRELATVLDALISPTGRNPEAE